MLRGHSTGRKAANPSPAGQEADVLLALEKPTSAWSPNWHTSWTPLPG